MRTARRTEQKSSASISSARSSYSATDLTNAITIDLDRVREKANVGIRRAFVFMGFGVNAANNSEFAQFNLPSVIDYGFLPREPDASELDEFKEHFRHWVVGNGLRELEETFALFLDAIFDACLLTHNTTKPDVKSTTLALSCTQAGIEKKLRLLKEHFLVESDAERHLISLAKARNCLTHRRGIVSQADFNRTDGFVLSWYAVDVIFDRKNEAPISLSSHTSTEPITSKEGGKIIAKFENRERIFGAREVIDLSAYELRDICFSQSLITKSYLESAVAFLVSQGIEPRNFQGQETDMQS